MDGSPKFSRRELGRTRLLGGHGQGTYLGKQAGRYYLETHGLFRTMDGWPPGRKSLRHTAGAMFVLNLV